MVSQAPGGGASAVPRSADGPGGAGADPCDQMPGSYEFQQDVAIVGRLGVGTGCPVDQPERVWVNGALATTGDLRTSGELRVGKTVSGQDVGFRMGSGEQISSARLRAQADTTIALDGSLTVRDVVGLGATLGTDPTTAPRLTVRATSSSTAVPSQIWQDADGNARTAVDASGRVGVGTTAPAASLSVHGTFLTKLTGQVRGRAGDTVITGLGTAFEDELVQGSTLSIPSLDTPPTAFRVVKVTSPTELVVDKAPEALFFTQQDAYTDAPLLSVRDGLGTEWLSLNSAGTLQLGNGTVSISGTGVVTATQFVGLGAVATGIVAMWSGTVSTIPTGWALCDGQDGRPDLRSRFVVGAGSEYQPTQSGPADVHAHPVAPPAGSFQTSTAGSHTHKFPPQWTQQTFGMFAATYTGLRTNGADPQNVTVQSDGAHAHAVGVAINPFTSGSSAGQNRPAWYALAYIIKL